MRTVCARCLRPLLFGFVLLKKILCVMGKRETWKFIIQTLAAILSAIATSFGVASCCCEVIRF